MTRRPYPTLVIPSRLYRVSRVPDPAALPSWEYAGEDRTFGGRWDDPNGRYRVLYTADSRIGALVETLQDFRPSLKMLARLREIEHDDFELDRKDTPIGRGSGIVPARFFEERLAGEIAFGADPDAPSGRVVDAGHVDAIERLRKAFADFAVRLGIDEISLAEIVGELPALIATNPRLLTQRISREIYEQYERFAGIAAPSSLGLPYSNYTIFEDPDAHGPDRLRVPVLERTARKLEREDPDVRRALEHLQLKVERARERGRSEEIEIE